MIDKAKIILNKKHLLIIGKSEIDRYSFISEIIEQTNFETFRFPKGMKSIDEYIKFVRKKNLYTPWYSQRGKHGSNQILDFHRDWITENNSLVVLEEFQNMEDGWKLDLLGSYSIEVENRKKGQKIIHLIISQENEDGLIDKLCETVRPRENESRTKRQIVEGGFEVITIK